LLISAGIPGYRYIGAYITLDAYGTPHPAHHIQHIEFCIPGSGLGRRISAGAAIRAIRA
jgi:hypothetical protein